MMHLIKAERDTEKERKGGERERKCTGKEANVGLTLGGRKKQLGVPAGADNWLFCY